MLRMPPTTTQAALRTSRAYTCQCGRRVYLANSECLYCRTALGYVVDRLAVLPLVPLLPLLSPEQLAGGFAQRFTVWGEPQGRHYQRCGNFGQIGCNWLVPVPALGELPDANLAPGLCLSCSCTRTIPDLHVPEHLRLWRQLELAKRRVLSQCLALGLPLVTRLAEPATGLAFDILTDQPGQARILTGHQDGVITLNAAEADDAMREQIRAAMLEPYRTLVGHFRHELGHYYWDVLLRDSPAPPEARRLFGDDTQDYGAALEAYYQQGPATDWPARCVTPYASAHPWEDWAETWAHYLHMADTLDTAFSFGMDASSVELSTDLFTPADLWRADLPGATLFLDFLNTWVRLTGVLNELSRSMGQHDFYPFVLPHAAVPKLQFIHELVARQRSGEAMP